MIKGTGMIKTIGSLAILLGMVGCGSTTTVSGVGTGYYVDSAVSGVEYTCGNQQGKTDSRGMFKFESGKECNFAINGKVFKVVAADRLIDEVVLQESDEVIARFLMTLDSDGDAENGITILPEVASKVSKVPKTDTDFALLNTVLNQSSEYHGNPISLKEAKNHLAGLIEIEAQATVSDTNINYGQSITLSALDSTISSGEITAYKWMENGKIISREAEFSKSDFSVGNHTITLTVTAENGVESSMKVSFEVVAVTKWSGISMHDQNGESKLYITSDEENLYLKLESPEDLEKVLFFIDSDDSRISGYQSSTYTKSGFDYVLRKDGLYKLLHKNDFASKLQYPFSYQVSDGTLEVAIPKGDFPYLAKDISVVAFFPDDTTKNIPTSENIKKFEDSHYNANQPDVVAPIITVIGSNPMVIDVGDSFVDEGASAEDVRVGSVNVRSDISGVDSSKEGFYNVLYTATDGINTARAARIVQVKGAPSQNTLEVKKLGALQESVVINHQTGQVWANDNTLAEESQAETRGCLIIGHDAKYIDLKGMFAGFCERSDYAGLKWRTPTSIEISKFSIRMAQEGKIPGMARHGCSRTLAIDNNTTVKAVWTHNMSQIGVIETDTLTPSGGRCVSITGQMDNGTGEFSIESKGETEDKIIIDKSKKLMWVNERDISKKACLAIHKDIPDTYEKSKGFCAALTHAGFSDWRDPRKDEMVNFIKRTNAVHILPGYEAPCKALLARDVNASDSNQTIETSISTRFDTVLEIGTVSPLVLPLTSNIGLRCVRDN
jgi:hypothetical protein